MTHTARTWIAFDIGGANLKAAHASGEVRSLPFELWKRPESLADELSRLMSSLPPADAVALTMTAELCDCFATKAEGVSAIVDATERASGGRDILVWGTDGRFHPPRDIRESPLIAAAANWLALATVSARLVPEGAGLLIDVGSTTTDLIPLEDGRVEARGKTDTERLRSGELVYAGARRTPLCALAPELTFRGGPIGLAAEVFATTLDVYLTLGDVADDPVDESTADGRPATAEHSRDRLARMICADRDGFGGDDARDLARAFDETLLDRLERAAKRALGAVSGAPRRVIVAGSGAFLARRLAARLVAPGGEVLGLEDAWGPAASSSGCAHALVTLASERDEAGHIPAPARAADRWL